MNNEIMGYIVNGLIFIGKVKEVLEDFYLMVDVVLIHIIMMPGGRAGLGLIPFFSETMQVPKGVVIFKPTKELQELYTEELAKSKGIEIPKMKIELPKGGAIS